MPTSQLSKAIVPHIPALRRFARIMTGTQKSGDTYIVTLLEELVSNPEMFPQDMSPKLGLYHIFLKVWNSISLNHFPNFDAERSEIIQKIETLTPRPRQALILMTVEGFDTQEVAKILDVPVAEATRLMEIADDEIKNQLDPAGILIIEDEELTSMQLEDLVVNLGHHVVGVARTHREAVEILKDKQPDLVLSDIQLADGSSGLDAVNEILRDITIPVIFITGHPDLLLTGDKPEPAFLISKPFDERSVKAVIGQALFFAVGAEPHSKTRHGTQGARQS
jgi:CheY-like chemotaxis protein/DNA-directed RNA polymerase specialized sigma24 family protein